MTAPPIPVAYFSNARSRGGAEEHILTLLRLLDRRLFRFHLICSPDLARVLAPDLPEDVDLVPLRYCRPRDALAALRLARILRRRSVGILHSHLFYSSLFASPVGWLCRLPVIIETPHLREEWRKGFIKSRFFVDRMVGRLVDHYIAVSEANARYLIQEKGIPAGKVTVIQNGTNLDRFQPSHPVPNGLRESLGFGAGDPILLVAARLELQKGHSVLLQALPAIRSRFPAVRLVCIGAGALRARLEDQARSLGLQDAVRFLGYQGRIEDWFALADLSVLPSYFEGLPLVAVESLAAGCPVVATAVDGTPEVVVDGKTGLTVPPGDPPRLAEAVCRMLADLPLRRRLAGEGRQWALDRFSEQRQVEQTRQLYLRLWEQRTGARPSGG